MTTEKFLQFFIKHNALLIESAIAIILLLAGFLAFRSFLASKNEKSGTLPADMSNLEDALKKIIEKANQVPQSTQAAVTAGSQVAPAAEVAALSGEITLLKQQLEKKQAEIETIKTAQPAAGAEAQPSGGGLSSKEKDDLSAQINELKRKLEEYDIISADIADLSFYKEENARLQKELSGKGGGSKPAEQKPVESVAAASSGQATMPEQSTMVSGGAAPVEEKIVVKAGGDAPVMEEQAVAVENVIDDDIMKDFAAAVADQSGGPKAPEPGVPPIDPLTATTMPNIDIPAIGEEKKSAEKKSEDSAKHLGDLDIDRMVSEVDALPDASTAETVDSLSQEMDPDKLALEAAKLSDVKPEEKDLMGQFENFIKKEKT